MYRAMLSFDGSQEGGLLRTNPNITYELYLNGTCYMFIYDAWINYYDNNRMGLLIENY